MTVMGVYFVWVCLEMASHTHAGVKLLIGIFAAAAAGVIALAIGLLWKR
jgi:hypothetical protein